MKIQCDVCDKDEASVFCAADEAALCAACDHRVHHANKLAGKHQRFSLHHPAAKQAPTCDICQERGAFFFCQQDRSILCSECDVPIHKTNEHTQKHTRFLLTGVKLSAASALYSASPPSAEPASLICLTNNNASDAVTSTVKSQDPKTDKPVSIIPPNRTPSTVQGTTVQSTTVAAPEPCEQSNVQMMNGGTVTDQLSASSISEYLMEMLPGWHVEDFLDSPPPAFCEKGESNDWLPLWDADAESNSNASAHLPTEKMGFWVHQVQPALHQTQNQSCQAIEILAFGSTSGPGEQFKEFTTSNSKSTRYWNEDNSFAVPQIIPPSSSAPKRSRIL